MKNYGDLGGSYRPITPSSISTLIHKILRLIHVTTNLPFADQSMGNFLLRVLFLELLLF